MCFAPLSFAPHLCALLEEASFQKHNEVEVLETFHLDTCFAPQPRALFPHRNFETCSDVGVFWACSCRHVLRATTACIVSSYSSHQMAPHPTMVFTKENLAAKALSEPTCRPSGATKHWEKTVFRDFSTFSRTVIFFLLTLSLLTLSLLWLLSPLLLHLSISRKCYF